MRYQKKLLMMIAALVVMVQSITGQAFADEFLTGSITQSEIMEGLKFCQAYPATLKYEGSLVEFPEDLCPPTIIRSRTLIPARQLFEAMGGKVDWNPDDRQVQIQVADSTVSLTIGSNQALVNGQEKPLEVPALIIDHNDDSYGSTMIPLRFVSEELGYTVIWDDAERCANVVEPSELPKLSEEASKKLICIDPGHGGEDPGAIGHEGLEDQLYESKINLETAKVLKNLLETAGAQVIMTREDDTKIGKYERAAFANNSSAILFISVHNNSSDRSSINGTTTYYYNKTGQDGSAEYDIYGISSEKLAAAIQESVHLTLGTGDNGIVEYPELAVLNKTIMPSIVIEGAYLSNETDFSLLQQDDYTLNYAFGIAQGLIKAMNEAWPSK